MNALFWQKLPQRQWLTIRQLCRQLQPNRALQCNAAGDHCNGTYVVSARAITAMGA